MILQELLKKTSFDDAELSVFISEDISDSEWEQFCLMVPKHFNLVKIEFNGILKEVSDERWNNLSAALNVLPNLKQFKIESKADSYHYESLVNILSRSWPAIFKLLSTLPHLEDLNLRLNDLAYEEIPTEIWDIFYTGLYEMTDLKALTLSGLGGLSETQWLDLFEFLGKLTKLEALNLNHNLFSRNTPENIAIFGNALAKQKLKVLNLAFNGLFRFNALQCAALTAALPATLEELNLSSNKLGQVWKYLAPGFVKLTNLKQFNLHENEMSQCLKASQVEDYKVLEKLTSLQYFDLSLNNLDLLDSKDVTLFCQTLSNIPKLSNLILANNDLRYSKSLNFFEGLSRIATPIQIRGICHGVEDFYNKGPIKTHLVNSNSNAILHTDYNRIRMLRTYASYIAAVRNVFIEKGDKRHLDIAIVCKILEFKFKKEEVKKIKAFFGVEIIPAQETSMFYAFKKNLKILLEEKKYQPSCCMS